MSEDGLALIALDDIGARAERYGHCNTLPATLHTPCGPCRIGPMRCTRVPSLAQQPIASQAVITFGGADRTGALLGARIGGSGNERSTTTGGTASGAEKRWAGGAASASAPRQARAASARSAFTRNGTTGTVPRGADAATASSASSAANARRQLADCGA